MTPTAPARRHVAVAGLLCALLMSACGRRERVGEPPLRPLLYTEGHGGIGEAPPALWEWTSPGYDPVAFPSEHATSIVLADAPLPSGPAATPRDLMLGVWDALARGDRAALAPYLFDAEGLSAAAHMGMDAARAEVADMDEAMQALLAAMSPGPASRARPDGLVSLLEPGQVVVGRPRNVDGSVADDDDDVPVMHWGNELQLVVAEGDGDASFTLRFGRILLGEDGAWRLAAAPTLDDAFDTFIALGLALKPEMLNPEHAAYPVSVGNYWHYRSRQPAVGSAEGEGYGVLTDEGYRDEVIDVTECAGYRIARIRRLFDNPSRNSETHAWLVTPTRLYDCDRECVRRADEMSWLLAWARRQVPTQVFPPRAGMSWGAGGLDTRTNVYRVQPDRAAVDVPAGVFDDAWEITRSTARGRESTFFVQGIGVVMRRQVASYDTTIEELVDYRVMQ